MRHRVNEKRYQRSSVREVAEHGVVLAPEKFSQRDMGAGSSSIWNSVDDKVVRCGGGPIMNKQHGGTICELFWKTGRTFRQLTLCMRMMRYTIAAYEA